MFNFRKIIPSSLKNYIKLIWNYCIDFTLFRKYSLVFKCISVKNKEAQLILNYHGIEKGLLHNPMKPRFAIDRVKKMHLLLSDEEIINSINCSQIYIGYKVILEYYDIHKEINIEILDYYTEEQYYFYKSIVEKNNNYEYFSGVKNISFQNLYKGGDFREFSFSRKSIRNFNGEKIKTEILKNVIELANNAPSVCNRQASKVYLLEDKSNIVQCLEIQGGFNGFIENVNQLLILTVDRSYFYITGERNQFYIDGGIYLLNLLYALHFYRIAACPANWGKDFFSDKKIRKIINIPESEQIICLVPIGHACENNLVTLSYRRSAEEVLNIIG